MLLRVLLVTDSRHQADRLEHQLASMERVLSVTCGRNELWATLSRENFDLIVAAEDALPAPLPTLLPTLRKLPENPEVVVLKASEDPLRRAELLTAGAMAVLNLALPDDVLGQTLAALMVRRRDAAVSRIRADQGADPEQLSDFSSRSPAMLRLLDTARRLVRADTSLLILGETGVGKEWLARAIHNEGPRAASPFIAVNCAAVPEAFLESELFGHEKGAFTGSIRARRGQFELAHRGTLFLDEIGDMAPHLQAKLLRVLQERKIQRLGSERPIDIDVRLMAATNRDLAAAIADGSFRSDLYYRLGVVTLEVPPLRSRREDIEPLASAYLERFRVQLRRHVDIIDPAAMQALVGYRWPGNVRELINVMERAVLLASGPAITPFDLPDAIAATPGQAQPASDGSVPQAEVSVDLATPLHQATSELVERFERSYLLAALERSRGRVGETARLAGLDPRSLYAKMRRYGLRKELFK